ncbi:hypothetical protein GCM10007421_09810 [Halopseudomonas oceani]|uniref:DUF1302 domain-containing protein n=1 Tax=Halopseudomonas oceani TaxID=1708783 RepID=A0A2P4EXH1_9GAMM|nr:DUF1302 domain-containing protein [Halopseudomonas oceani]POB04708.1 DUF1302 domain-containing protein [Halopseudomonas oceani]GGE38012.1 hypothetical protein GCM10007421_09810 [Halopseudomonas oceani]
MTKKMHAWSLAALPLAIGLASFSGSAGAVNFNIGDVQGQLDSQISIGMSVSTADADKRFIHNATSVDGKPQGGKAVARTSDDGRLNYEKGDIFSKIFRGVHDLELRYGDSGAFVRGKYWYDFETKDGSQEFYDIDDSGRPPLVKGAGVALLDAFVYHNYFIGNNPGNVRLGRQVVSWGESTFIGNSINSINPIDVAAFRRPGAEIKEGLLPVEMLYISQGLTENLSLEAFYQLKWHPYAIDNCGTFFGADTLATGCTDRLVASGPDLPQGDPALGTGGFGQAALADYIVRSEKDREAKDEGQFGVALRWFVPELNDSEFGFYAMNYHSRTPIYSNTFGGVLSGEGPAGIVQGLDGALGGAGYFFEYPEDIRLYGVSFQTSVAGTSLGGEFSYRPNMPMQINTGDMSRTALLNSDNIHRGVVYGAQDYIQGYDRKEFYQAQVTAIRFIERVLGASRLALVGEAGVNYIGGIGNDAGDTRYGRDSLFGQSPYADGTCSSQAGNDASEGYQNSWCENDGFYTDWSWGYRVRAKLDYSNVIAGINLSPTLAWSHDVDGYGPNFTEGAKSVSIGLDADYANKYNASISYTNFFDGKYNTAVDRDFAAVSFSVSF